MEGSYQMIVLRPANKKDKKFFINCYNQKDSRTQMERDVIVKPLWYKDIINKPTSLWFIIEDDKTKVGLVNTYWKGEEYQWGIIIHPSYRRKGYARASIKKILKITDKNKLKTYIECFADNFAVNLYEELGYKKIGEDKIIRNRIWIKMERNYNGS